MSDFGEARKIAFEAVSQFETVKIVDKSLLGPKLKVYTEVWELNKLCENENGIGIDLTLYLCFSITFPLNIPTIYLSKKSYDEVKHIPHIDSNYLICTFDTEKTRTDPEDPIGIVLTCLNKARLIIEKGIRKENFQDFTEEFLSYWECSYSDKDIVGESVLSLISESPNEKPVKSLILTKKFGPYKYILYQESEENKQFKNFLSEYKIEFEEVEIFYSDKIQIEDFPPFDLTNKQAIELINNYDYSRLKEFEKLITASKHRILVLFPKTVNNKIHYLGWFHSKPITTRDGFRPGSINPLKALQTFQGTTIIERISPVEYTTKRITQRTSGIDESTGYKFCVAGIGSIGSNLVHFLNSLSFPQFKLIDYDILTIENMGRHLLGLNYINKKKTLCTREHLKLINPKQIILTKESTIINILEKESEFINDNDYLFIAIGKHNIESWIADKIKSKDITKPTFIFWVEPYLAGGHCLYIHPNDFKYDEFYQSTENLNLFRYNIINENEYIQGNKLLSLKEASCQSSFTPYSGSNLLLFMSAIFPKIVNIMTQKSENSIAISWIGDKILLDKLSIKMSDFALKNQSFQLIENHS